MKPIILTATDGKPRRINPLQLVAWYPGLVTVRHENKDHLVPGSIAVFDGGPRQVMETSAEIDRMFEEATKALIIGVIPGVDSSQAGDEGDGAG